MASIEKSAGGSPARPPFRWSPKRLRRWSWREMAPGTPMPSEGDLATRFEVSRHDGARGGQDARRPAACSIVGRGRRRHRQGTDRNRVSPTSLSTVDPRTIPRACIDLIELRMSLEVQSATLAARRASRASIAALETAIQGMRDARRGRPRRRRTAAIPKCGFHDHDVGFPRSHRAVERQPV